LKSPDIPHISHKFFRFFKISVAEKRLMANLTAASGEFEGEARVRKD
jgi:hypothetical protein